MLVDDTWERKEQERAKSRAIDAKAREARVAKRSAPEEPILWD